MDQFAARGQCLSMLALFARGNAKIFAWMLTSVVKTLARMVCPATNALAVHTARLRINFSRIDATSSAGQRSAVVRLATAVKMGTL